MKNLVFACLAFLIASGCSIQPPSLPDAGNSLFVTEDGGQRVAYLGGFAWDPEAYLVRFATCGMDCPDFPATVEFSGLFAGSKISEGSVALFDFATGPVGFAQSDAEGQFTMNGIPMDGFFFITSQGPGTLISLPDDPLPPVPPAPNYLPTVTGRPVATAYPVCYYQEAGFIGDNGVLQAVAKVLGKTPADLIDGAQYGGVQIFFLWQPGFALLRVPAFGTGISSNTGTTYQIDWAPPGVLPPAANQSDRGFFVSTDPVSPIGLTVIVHDLGGPGSATYSVTDPVTDPDQGRPWTFDPLEIPVGPGSVSYSGLQLNANFPGGQGGGGGGDLPPYLCLPF